MIHPQYIIACMDQTGKFNIRKFNNKYIFEINFYSSDVAILYKIKERFKTGKIILLGGDLNVLKITNNIDIILQFFYKNKLLNKNQSVTFYKFAYLFQKINQTDLSKKEQEKIKKRLMYFEITM